MLTSKKPFFIKECFAVDHKTNNNNTVLEHLFEVIGHEALRSWAF